MPRLHDLKARLTALPEDAAISDLQPLAAELVQRCSAESYPRKSVSAFLRHARPHVAEPAMSVFAGLAEAALEDEQEAPTSPAPAIAEPFLGIGEAARRLNVSVKTMAERLREVRYRRLYGWPWWDGHQWSFSPAAVDPVARPGFMATLPENEPAAHVAMLPSWCERAEPAPQA